MLQHNPDFPLDIIYMLPHMSPLPQQASRLSLCRLQEQVGSAHTGHSIVLAQRYLIQWGLTTWTVDY